LSETQIAAKIEVALITVTTERKGIIIIVDLITPTQIIGLLHHHTILEVVVLQGEGVHLEAEVEQIKIIKTLI
tara:strand:- start:177 stop:395 length:219 start_codon:yes stop_codon:yes gene_type:complete